MKPTEIKKDIYWLGAVEWNLKDFHSYTHSDKGTSYNAYLIKDEKNVLIDSLEKEYKEKLFCGLAQTLKGEKLHYLVVNHIEPDHAGVLTELVEKYQPEKIFCSPMADKNLASFCPKKDTWPIVVTPTGTNVSIGKRSLTFVEARMLHWPDNMATYCPEEKMLFSNDAFGQNYASSKCYIDEVGREVIEPSLARYYGNIILPYSAMVLKILPAIAALDIDMICPAHGLIWRGEDCQYALDKYQEYAEQKPTKKAVIVYSTIWHTTEKMAEAIASGLHEAGVEAKIMDAKIYNPTEIMCEVMNSGGVIFGAPTHNNGILPQMGGVLTYLKGLRPQNKLGFCFGSYGWSGESIAVLEEWMQKMNIESFPLETPLKIQNSSNHEILKKCLETGKAFGEELSKRVDSLK